jgi:hypothetical protein
MEQISINSSALNPSPLPLYHNITTRHCFAWYAASQSNLLPLFLAVRRVRALGLEWAPHPLSFSSAAGTTSSTAPRLIG